MRLFFVMEIRKPAENEIAEIIRMMRDFAEFEKLGDYFEATEERLRRAIFGENAFVEALIAEHEGFYAGYALFFAHFSSFRAQPGYYLDDLYVDPAFRGEGVGEALLRRIALLGAARGFERIDLQVLDWNAAAIRFYEKLGAVRNDEERHFKFAGEAFARLATG